MNIFATAGAVELRNEIGRAFQSELPGTLVFDYPTISAIAGLLAAKLQTVVSAAANTPLQPLQCVTDSLHVN